MDEEQTKSCPNCKRDIPSVNFTIHTVHCARNIRVCPVCKEPVPLSDLQRHHDEFHKQLPCKQCGEKVCGTDLEDHLRDSCANTIKSCRYCELELARRELPAHEGYCGVRTEQCPECREWVMIKYRQLHLDSNHGFLRLDDDPAPIPRKEVPKSNINLLANQPSTSNGFPRPTFNPIRQNAATALTQALSKSDVTKKVNAGTSTTDTGSKISSKPSSSNQPLGTKVTHKRTNDQPQININVGATDKVNKDLPPSRGAVKKRPAPKPPVRVPPASPHRDLPYYSALERHQKEEKRRNEQNAYNLSVGLPPVLNPAQKIEKLRKMDALHNREVVDNDYKNRLQGKVWSSPVQNIGSVLGQNKESRNTQTTKAGSSQGDSSYACTSGNAKQLQNKNLVGTSSTASESSNSNLRVKNSTAENNVEKSREEFKNLKPMTPEEFIVRFNELQMRKDDEDVRRNERSSDRFSEIKSSLRELRRGLNEVTAPYNANSGSAFNNLNNDVSRLSPSIAMDVSEDEDFEEKVELPCEFCGVQVPMDDLVQHQTGCRPDLAQYRMRGSPGVEARARGSSPARGVREEPVIPCEFCSESLPVYLITEHQKRCGRDNNHTVMYYTE